MTCWRFRLRRKFVPYIEGGLAPSESSRLEEHLLDCASCRALLLRLRSAHQSAQGLRDVPAPEGVPDFGMLLAEAENSRVAAGGSWAEAWLDRFATPRVVEVLALIVVVQLGLLVFSNRSVLLGARPSIAIKPASLSLAEFRTLSISELKTNTQPHVSTDGYVTEIHSDDDEGTIQFKLAQNSQGGGPFVICEIIGDQAEVPRAGSHVRVYGVERYDGQSDRQWYEVNPVLKIAQANR